MVLRRSIRVKGSDGAIHRVALPKASRVKLGGKASVPFCDGSRLVLLWFRRVKGGWEVAR